MLCPHGQGGGGLSQCGQEEGDQSLAILCGSFLWTAPCKKTITIMKSYPILPFRGMENNKLHREDL